MPSLCEFIGSPCVPDDPLAGGWSSCEAEALRICARVLGDKRCEVEGHAFVVLRTEEGYGTTLLGSTSPSDESRLHVALIGLDRWEFGAQNGGKYSAAPAGRPSYLKVGHISSTAIDAFHAAFTDALTNAQKLSGQARHANNSNGGHQKTPAFIAEVATAAVNAANGSELKGLQPPHGGFTDVGQHTGAAARECKPALEAALLYTILHRVRPLLSDPLDASFDPDVTFELCMARFHLACCEDAIAQLSLTERDVAAIDAAAVSLMHACRHGAALADSQRRDMSSFLVQCEKARALLQSVAAQQATQVASKYVLRIPPLSDVLALPSPSVSVSVTPMPSTAALDLAAAKKNAVANIGWVPHLPHKADVTTAKAWFDSCAGRIAAEPLAAYLTLLTETEHFVLQMAMRLPLSAGDDSASPVLSASDALTFEDLVDAYRRQAWAFRASKHAAGMNQSALRSKEVLVVWAAYCIVHQTAGQAHPQLLRHQTAPAYGDLEHLVLTDGYAVTCMTRIAAYLRGFSGGSSPAFSGRSDDGTYNLADAVAAADSALRAYWAADSSEAEKRRKDRWEQVQTQKRQCEEIRKRLWAAERELSRVKSEVEAARDALYLAQYSWKDRSTIRNSHRQDEINAAQRRVDSINDELTRVQAAPAPIIQPLPRDEALGRRAEFFLHTPRLLMMLARFSFECYQVMYAPPPSGTKPIEGVDVVEAPQGLHSYFTFHNMYNPNRRADIGLNFAIFSEQPPKEIPWTRNVEDISSDGDGIWHLRSFQPPFLWSGGPLTASGFLNPYLVPRARWVDVFTEPLLAASSSSLQWAIGQPGMSSVSTKRSNWGLARQHTRPTGWLNKPQYLAFAALRAYPRQQLRVLAACLHDGLLPLSVPAVHTLVLQTLYHTGPLEPAAEGEAQTAGSLRLAWRGDIEAGSDGLATLAAELDALAEQLTSSPARHEEVLLLGQVAAYLASLQSDCADRLRGIACRFSTIAVAWADDVAPQLQKALDEADYATAIALRARQHQFLTYALTAFGCDPTADVTAADVALMLDIRVRMHATQPLLTSGSSSGSATSVAGRPTAAALAQIAMAAHARGLQKLVLKYQGAITAAARRIIPWLPSDLSWSMYTTQPATGLQVDVSCAEAQAPGAAGSVNLISVNLLTGTVLFNGSPPGYLPSSIVQHPLYKRVFGDRNCSVVAQASGVLRTAQPLSGRQYEFLPLAASPSGKALFIDELVDATPTAAGSSDVSVRYRLLDGSSDEAFSDWAGQLPVRLRYMHSHWVTSDLPSSGGAPVLLFRPVAFNEHHCSFIQLLTSDSAGPNPLYRIPSEAGADDPNQLVQRALAGEFERMLQPSTALTAGVLKVLSKLESQRYMECYAVPGIRGSADGSMRISLPRFGLQFELLAGGSALRSVDYRGRQLSSCQQLNDTLPGITRYLVLEAIDADAPDMVGQPRLWLVTSIFPSGSEGPANRQRTSIFDVHPRFGCLTAPTILSRLQLAYWYAKSGSLLQDPRAGMTGGEAAMALVRQCWVNRPLSDEERSFLTSLAECFDRTPGLRLLCDEMERSSRQLAFLHVASANSAAAAASTAAIDRYPRGSPLFSEHASTEYALFNPLQPRNVRLRLTSEEEAAVTGESTAGNHTSTNSYRWDGSAVGWSCIDGPALQTLDVDVGTGIPTDLVQRTEAALLALTSSVGSAPAGTCEKPFPLPSGSSPSDTAIGRLMLGELKESWDEYQRLPLATLAVMPKQALQACTDHQAIVMSARQRWQYDLLQALECVPVAGVDGSNTSCSRHAAGFRMLRACNDAPVPTLRDLVRSSWDPQWLRAFNPFLSPAAVSKLQAAVNQWMQLCVLEDRLSRILAFLRAVPAPAAQPSAPSTVMTQSLTADGHLTASPAAPANAPPPSNSSSCEVELVVRELRTTRDWDPVAHPQWLAFEVENALQIRPEQYAIIQAELAHNGAITQLNMGLGKTRVVVPCLLLHLAAGATASRRPPQSDDKDSTAVASAASSSAPTDCIVRLYFLSQLLDEGYDYLHRTLTASVLGRHLFRLPFHRDVELTPERTRAILNVLQTAKRVGGAIILAPEHRQSLQLKWHELNLDCRDDTTEDATPLERKVQAGLERIDGLRFADLFDESDEILHHRKQLVYAVGQQTDLPDGTQRWLMIQAVLERCRQDAAIRSLLLHGSGAGGDASQTTSMVASLDSSAPAHRYNGMRLLPGTPLEELLPSLYEAIMTSLLKDPPRSLAWVLSLPDKHALILRAATDISVDVEVVLKPSDVMSDEQYASVLMLRGLLAHGMLAHRLQKRHRVNFGIPRCPSARIKRLAVPFTAADTPSARSEFAQPDCALVFTQLAYWHDGLSPAELKEALKVLLTLGDNARQAEFAEWFELSAPCISDEEKRASINCVAKVDLTNDAQFGLLCDAFCHNMRTINFWLNSCVYPDDTKVYPSRLLATAWHLTHGSVWRGGFSGTNDSSILLPFGVEQTSSSQPELRATNGKMVSHLLAKATYQQLPSVEAAFPLPSPTSARGDVDAVTNSLSRWCCGANTLSDIQPLPPLSTGASGESSASVPYASPSISTADAVLDFAIRGGYSALVDVGALMAGLSNSEVADAILARLRRGNNGSGSSGAAAGSLRGVVFFEPSSREWVVKDVAHGHVWPLASSPVPASEAFAFYDESRCRGADLKLAKQAVAVLTLCPRLPKASLMQAAGRLRGLDYGQRIVLLAPPEVDAMIREIAAVASSQAVSVRHVLEYVTLSSTVAAAGGLSQWGWHGTHFATTHDCPEAACMDDHIGLKEMYGRDGLEVPVSETWGRVKTTAVTRRGSGELGPQSNAMLDAIAGRMTKLGKDVLCRGTGTHDEECERELEKEVEEEEEQEVQPPEVEPRAETDWRVESALVVTSPDQVSLAGIQKLDRFVAQELRLFRNLPWDAVGVYATSNFCNTVIVSHAASSTGLTNYLRPIDALLVYPSSQSVLLLSEREAERLLPILWQQRRRGASSAASAQPVFVNLAFLREWALASSASHTGRGSSTRPHARMQLPAGVPTPSVARPLAALQLFAGETMFHCTEARIAVRALLANRAAIDAALRIPVSRGTSHLLDRSHLQEDCDAATAAIFQSRK